MHNVAAYTWIGFIAYVIIAYLIGYASMTVFRRCPQIKEIEMVDVDKIAASGIAFTTFSFLGMLILFGYFGSRGDVNRVIMGSIRGDETTIPCMAIGGITLLCLLLSLALTSSSEFMGIKAMNNCSVLQAANQDEVDEYLEAANMLNRLYGIIILAITIIIVFLLYLLSKMVQNKTGYNMDVVSHMDRFVTSFGRRARCSKNNRIKKRMYKI